MANTDLAIHSAVQEIIEIFHFATERSGKGKGFTSKSLKLQIKTAGKEEEDEACLFHLKLHSDSTKPDEFMSSLTQTQDHKLLAVLSTMQITEDVSHLCVQYFQSPGLITQKSFQVRHGEEQSQLVLHCISTSTKSSKKPLGVTIHIRILLAKHKMMCECQKMYKYLWLYKMFNPKTQLEFNMKIFENLCVSDFSCTTKDISGTPLEICGDTSYFLRNTSYICTVPCVMPVYSEMIQLCEGTGDSSYHNTVTLQVVAHIHSIKECGGGSRLRTCSTEGLVNLYIFGPEAVPIFPVLEVTSIQYNPLKQVPWNMYDLDVHSASTSVDDKFSSHFAAVLESTVLPTCKTMSSKFAIFIHVHFGINSQTTQVKLGFCEWLHKNYPIILTDHQKEIDKVISEVVVCLLKPYRETDKKTECYIQAIPNMVKSISYILSHSNNEEFRQSCCRLLSIDNSQVVESVVTDRLWDIASKRCGVRGQTKVIGHSQIKTNSPKLDHTVINPNQDEAGTRMSFSNPGQTSSESGFPDIEQEPSQLGSCFGDRSEKTFIGSSYTDLEKEMSTSYFMAREQETSNVGFGFTDQRQETVNINNFADLGNELSVLGGFTDGISHGGTIIDREQDIYTQTMANTSLMVGQEYSKEVGSLHNDATCTGNGSNVIRSETHTGGSFIYLGQETSTLSGYSGLQESSYTESGFMVTKEENSILDNRHSFGLSNLTDSSTTHRYGDTNRKKQNEDPWSPPLHFSSQVDAACVDTLGREYRDNLTSIHHGNDDGEIQGDKMVYPVDVCSRNGPSKDVLSQHGYSLCNNDVSYNTQVSSLTNQHMIGSDCFNDLGQHHMTTDLNLVTGQQEAGHSFQGHNLDGQEFNGGTNNSFDDVLENVQQWLNEF